MWQRAWSLVIFTLWIQMTVGTFVALTVFQRWASPLTPPDFLNRITDSILDVSAPLLISGIIAAIFHLRKPDNAYYSILNIRSSWLSRETFLGLIFGMGFVVFSILHWSRVGSIQARSILEILTSLSGLTLVYTMSKVYMLRTVPTWNTILTPLAFFTTTLLLGTLTFGAVWIWQLPAILESNPQPSLIDTPFQWIMNTSAVLVGLQILWTYGSYRRYRHQMDTEAASHLREWILYRLVLIFRVALGVIGIAFLFNLMDGQLGDLEHTGLRVIPIIIAFLLVLASEIMGRFLFFASYKRVGL